MLQKEAIENERRMIVTATLTSNYLNSLNDNESLENITSNSDFDFDILGKQPTVLYCCIPDESKIYYALVSIVVSLKSSI